MKKYQKVIAYVIWTIWVIVVSAGAAFGIAEFIYGLLTK